MTFDGMGMEILGIDCSEPLSCQGATFQNYICPSGEECEITCAGEPSMDMGSCEGATFTNIQGFKKVTCEEEMACKNAVFSLPFPAEDFLLECKGILPYYLCIFYYVIQHNIIYYRVGFVYG